MTISLTLPFVCPGEAGIHRTRTGQPAQDAGPAHQDLAGGAVARVFNDDGRNIRVDLRCRNEGCIQRAVAVQPGNIFSRGAVITVEMSADQHLPIRIHRQAVHTRAASRHRHARAGRIAGIARAVAVQACDSIGGFAIDIS